MSNQLKGSLDYLLQHHQTFLVIEAKNEDLKRGFVQLAIGLSVTRQHSGDREPFPLSNR